MDLKLIYEIEKQGWTIRCEILLRKGSAETHKQRSVPQDGITFRYKFYP